MELKNISKEKIHNYCQTLENNISKDYIWVKYLDTGVKVIKLINYSEEFTHLIEKQIPYILRDNANKFDTTLVVWKESDIENLLQKISDDFNPRKNLRLRVEMLASRQKQAQVNIIRDGIKVFGIDTYGFVNAIDEMTNTYYYGVKNLEPEEFIKEGHIFVQQFNRILKNENTNLVHGAVVGFNSIGALFCARGQRGKSTLAVLSMLKGLEYVSDDYLILNKENDELYSYPIYSIITLSPKMYNELFKELAGSRFLFNNARKDKYVINIANHHNQFRKKYPIKVCIFPEIVSDENPSIEPCEKGRAITQLIQSSVSQMQDISDNQTVKKMLDMVSGFDFYKMNLCSDINKNTEYLKDFLMNFKSRERKTFIEEKMYEDITFDLANILNSETGVIYSMNKFATNIYQNLKLGVSKEAIIDELLTIPGMPKSIALSVNAFVEALKTKVIINTVENKNSMQINLNKSFAKEDKYRISLIEYSHNNHLELVREFEQEKLKDDELCIK